MHLSLELLGGTLALPTWPSCHGEQRVMWSLLSTIEGIFCLRGVNSNVTFFIWNCWWSRKTKLSTQRNINQIIGQGESWWPRCLLHLPHGQGKSGAQTWSLQDPCLHLPAHPNPIDRMGTTNILLFPENRSWALLMSQALLFTGWSCILCTTLPGKYPFSGWEAWGQSTFLAKCSHLCPFRGTEPLHSLASSTGEHPCLWACVSGAPSHLVIYGSLTAHTFKRAGEDQVDGQNSLD